MSGKAAKTRLTTRMQEVLRQLSFSRNIGNGIVTRAKIILMAFQKNDNQTIGRRLGVCGKTVGIWRRRWRDSFETLLQMQFTESAAAFQRAIAECLSDAPRSGSPGEFSPEPAIPGDVPLCVACGGIQLLDLEDTQTRQGWQRFGGVWRNRVGQGCRIFTFEAAGNTSFSSWALRNVRCFHGVFGLELGGLAVRCSGWGVGIM